MVKRRHGLNRCRYKGETGMKRWVGLGVIADNLVNIGREMKIQLPRRGTRPHYQVVPTPPATRRASLGRTPLTKGTSILRQEVATSSPRESRASMIPWSAPRYVRGERSSRLRGR
jgi:hypothetical protein